MTVYLILQSLISTYISRLQLNIVYEVNYIIVAFTKLLPPTILISKSFFLIHTFELSSIIIVSLFYFKIKEVDIFKLKLFQTQWTKP
jgi:hypothetical protein